LALCPGCADPPGAGPLARVQLNALAMTPPTTSGRINDSCCCSAAAAVVAGMLWRLRPPVAPEAIAIRGWPVGLEGSGRAAQSFSPRRPPLSARTSVLGEAAGGVWAAMGLMASLPPPPTVSLPVLTGGGGGGSIGVGADPAPPNDVRALWRCRSYCIVGSCADNPSATCVMLIAVDASALASWCTWPAPHATCAIGGSPAAKPLGAGRAACVGCC
jgi:hypothetical protein